MVEGCKRPIFSVEFEAIYIPPEPDALTDEEIMDDDVIFENDSPTDIDIAGTFELQVRGDEDIQGDEDIHWDSSDDETLAEKKRKLDMPTSSVADCQDPKWKRGSVHLRSQPISDEGNELEKIKTQLHGMSPLDIFFMYFDNEVLNLILMFSEKYAKDNNRHDFVLDRSDLLKFIGLLIFTGYHKLPQTQLYWSRDEDKGLEIVKNCMSRNRFYNIKRNIHLSDNSQLEKNDKFCKLRPLFDIINQKNLQFGVFSHNLSIDEQMVPYFGRHSCKMFIRGKPVRFGFKLWCICSSDGYLYQFIPYAGANPNKEKSALGMGGQVVVDLLSIVPDPSKHQIFFDNFFSSFKLFDFLTKKGFFATGTIRENRTVRCPLENNKSFAKKERGSYVSAHDTNTGISLVRWNDNSVVTVISNHYNEEPLSTAKRYNRKARKEVSIGQPNVVKLYNKNMGGVDLHDNGIANYRIGVSGKKWWWPLFVNTIDSVLVNAWKIYNFANNEKISQLDFKSYIALRLIKNESPNRTPSTSRVISELRYDNIGHFIFKSPTNSRRRCKICSSQTVFLCKKCNVPLHTDCFESYHTK